MEGNTNKRRGKYFEDVIVKDYRRIFRLDKYQCYRSGSSGARTTIEYNGDVSFNEPDKYPLITECKYYKNMTLDNFFPGCCSYINNWLQQINNQKHHYINNFNKVPLTIIVAGRPYDKHHHIVIENDDIECEDLDVVAGIHQYMIFYSSKMKRNYIMIDYIYLERLLEFYCLLEHRKSLSSTMVKID